jgi:tRNA nucleotidyltransferase (CCA-adding enzyme)
MNGNYGDYEGDDDCHSSKDPRRAIRTRQAHTGRSVVISEDGRMQMATQEQLLVRARAAAPIAAILEEVPDLLGMDAFIVGGTVRDLMLGRRFVDVDLAVDGDALKLATALGAVHGTESRFGTLAVIRDEDRYDLARTRSEHYPHPGALPEVEPARIDADLLRRDFTINAIALGLTGSREGQLLAVDGALDDLANRRLAVLHDRSFVDDPTRLFRLARYAARLQFEIAPHTRGLATQAITNDALDTISGTRVGNELRLLANEPDPITAFQAVTDLGLPWSLDAGTTTSALQALPGDGRRDLVVLASTFAHQPRAKLTTELDQLGFTASDRDAIIEAASQATDMARRLANTTSRAEIARTVGTAGIETVALASAEGAPSQSLLWLQELRHLHIQITGDDLQKNGLSEGPEIGKALQAAKDALLDGLAPDSDSQLQVALKASE